MPSSAIMRAARYAMCSRRLLSRRDRLFAMGLENLVADVVRRTRAIARVCAVLAHRRLRLLVEPLERAAGPARLAQARCRIDVDRYHARGCRELRLRHALQDLRRIAGPDRKRGHAAGLVVAEV